MFSRVCFLRSSLSFSRMTRLETITLFFLLLYFMTLNWKVFPVKLSGSLTGLRSICEFGRKAITP